MAEQLNSIEQENNFKNYLQVQMKILETMPKYNVNFHHNNKPLALLSLGEIFEFLEVHFLRFYETETFEAVVPFIHRGLEKWSTNWDNLSCDIGIILFDLLQKHTDDENEIAMVIQIISTIINFIKSMDNSNDVRIYGKVFMHLAEILPTIKNEKLASEIISCLKLYIEIYPGNRRDIIQSLWSDLSQRIIVRTSNTISINTEIVILIQFYDEFYEHNQNISEDPNVIATIQQLLVSEQKDSRKSGNFLCRKMVKYTMKKLNKFDSLLLTSSQIHQIEQLWTSFINILDNLEDEAYVITPCLEKLKVIVESKLLEPSWLEILYKRLLTLGNIDVLYCVMEFFLKTFTYSDLSDDIIEHLLKTSNSMLLYNHEGYFLEPELFKYFLKGDLTKLYELMGDIEWKSIPLYIWIKAIYENEKELSSTSITFEQILKLSSIIHNLEYSIMRDEIRKLIEQLTKQIVNNMSIKEYIMYVETLYISTSDDYKDFETFYSKISYLLETDYTENIFSQQLYEIFIRNLQNKDIEVQKFMKCLNNIPKKQRGWLRFIPYHYYENLNKDDVQLLNINDDINANNLKSCKLTEIIIKFEERLLTDLLPCDDKEESLVHSRLAAIAFYIQQKDSLDQEDDETLKIIFNPETSEYNNMEKFPILWCKLCECLQETNKKLATWIIDEFLKRIWGELISDKMLEYLSKLYDDNTKNRYFKIIFDKYPQNFWRCLNVYVNTLKLPNQSRFFNRDPVEDELMIRQIFCAIQFGKFDVPESTSGTKYIWLLGLYKYCTEEYILYLLKCHRELSDTKPIYNENSNEHIIKLRISMAIYYVEYNNIYTSKVYDEIWNILLNEYNELNICYIYEAIIGSYDTRVDTILEKLKQSHNLTSRQQMSVISVAYTYCMRRSLDSKVTKEAVITNLISLTMCSNSETRILAQMVLYKLLKTEQFKNILAAKEILQSIEIVMGTKLNENLNDVRLHMHYKELYNDVFQIVLFVTKAPLDFELWKHSAYISDAEHFFANMEHISPQMRDQISKCRETFLKKNKSKLKAQSITS